MLSSSGQLGNTLSMANHTSQSSVCLSEYCVTSTAINHARIVNWKSPKSKLLCQSHSSHMAGLHFRHCVSPHSEQMLLQSGQTILPHPVDWPSSWELCVHWMKVGASFPYGNIFVISWIRWIAKWRPVDPSEWLSRARTAALKAQQTRWHTAHGSVGHVVHFKFLDFQPLPVAGCRGYDENRSWS